MTHLYKNNFEKHHFLGYFQNWFPGKRVRGLAKTQLPWHTPHLLSTPYYNHCSPRPSVVFKELWLEDKDKDKDLRSKDKDL